MRIHHHIMFNKHPRLVKALTSLGFAVDDVVVVDLYEDDPRWLDVRKFREQYNGTDICSTEFSDEELARAAWVQMFCEWHNGFPQPKEDYAYLRETYDVSAYCPECGSGAIQDRPFRIRKAPSWKRHRVMMLNWVGDAYFMSPETWEQVFAPFGIGYWPVLKYGTDSVLPEIVQLRIETHIPLCLEGYPYETCATCSRPRYNYIRCGPFPPMATDPGDAQMVQSEQTFGAGLFTYRETIVSQQLYQRIRQYGLRPLVFQPLHTTAS